MKRVTKRTINHLRCAWCEHKFNRPNTTGRKPQYCSANCRQRAYEHRQPIDPVDILKREHGVQLIRQEARRAVLELLEEAGYLPEELQGDPRCPNCSHKYHKPKRRKNPNLHLVKHPGPPMGGNE